MQLRFDVVEVQQKTARLRADGRRVRGTPEMLDVVGLPARTATGLPPLVEQRAQRLDRANWEWVIDDMKEFGCSKIVEDKYKAKIVDYLVENYGPNVPK